MPNRCAAHPGRPAVDACPVCQRERCGADAASWESRGCTVCGGRSLEQAHRPPGDRERLVRAALATHVATVLWASVQAQYVQASLFEYLAPAVMGVASAQAGIAASGHPTGRVGAQVRLVAVVYAVLGCALGFVLEGTFGVFSTSTDVLLPYVIAPAVAAFWATPPRPKKAAAPREA